MYYGGSSVDGFITSFNHDYDAFIIVMIKLCDKKKV